MSAQLEHTMIKDGRPRLQQIRNKTYELNSLLWAALHTGDDNETSNGRRSSRWR
jgi:hypothetical protein